MQAYNWVFRRTSIWGFKNCFFLPFFVIVILLPKVSFPNYHWKQKEFRCGQDKLILKLILKSFFAHQISINTQWIGSWWRKVIYDKHSFQCAVMLPFNSVWLCNQKNEVWAFFGGRSGPKQRLSENFLNYSAAVITIWILLLKELSQPSQLHCPADNPKNGMLTLFPCANKTTNTTVNIHKHMQPVRGHAQETVTLDKGTVIVNFSEAANGIFYSITYFTNQCFLFFFSE